MVSKFFKSSITSDRQNEVLQKAVHQRSNHVQSQVAWNILTVIGKIAQWKLMKHLQPKPHDYSLLQWYLVINGIAKVEWVFLPAGSVTYAQALSNGRDTYSRFWWLQLGYSVSTDTLVGRWKKTKRDVECVQYKIINSMDLDQKLVSRKKSFPWTHEYICQNGPRNWNEQLFWTYFCSCKQPSKFLLFSYLKHSSRAEKEHNLSKY